MSLILPLRTWLKQVKSGKDLIDVLWTTGASVLVKLRGVLQIFVISQLAGIDWYAAYALIFALSTYTNVLGTLMLPDAIVRFFPAELEVDRDRLFLFFSGLVLALSLCILALFLPFARTFTATFLKDDRFLNLVLWGAGLFPLVALQHILQEYYRSRDDLKGFALISASLPVLELMVVPPVLWITRDLLFALQLYLAAGFSLIGFIFLKILLRANRQAILTRSHCKRLGKYLKFSLPLCPGAIAGLFSSNGDRFLIGLFLGAEAVGLYGAAYALASTLMLFNTSIVNTLFPKMSRSFVEHNLQAIRAYLRKGVFSYTIIGFVMLAVLTMLGNFCLTVLLGEPALIEKYQGLRVTQIVTLALIAYGVSRIYSLQLLVLEQTKVLLVISLAGTLANLVLNVILIPLAGASGAALSTLAAYLLILGVVFYWLSVKSLTFGRVF